MRLGAGVAGERVVVPGRPCSVRAVDRAVLLIARLGLRHERAFLSAISGSTLLSTAALLQSRAARVGAIIPRTPRIGDAVDGAVLCDIGAFFRLHDVAACIATVLGLSDDAVGASLDAGTTGDVAAAPVRPFRVDAMDWTFPQLAVLGDGPLVNTRRVTARAAPSDGTSLDLAPNAAGLIAGGPIAP